MENIQQKLLELDACPPALVWCKDKTWDEIYETCPRGDWFLWLAVKSKCFTTEEITLAKGLCAQTVLHIMKDERSKKAVKAAIEFGQGLITKEVLDDYAKVAAEAAYAASEASKAAYNADDAADAAAYAAYNAAYAAAEAAYAASEASKAASAAVEASNTASAAVEAAYAVSEASKAASAAVEASNTASAYANNQLQTASICRSIFPKERFIL